MSKTCQHIPVIVYRRPWWNWFRKMHEVRCWKCDMTAKVSVSK